MVHDQLVDPDLLREQVREKYREVAADPERGYHFHTGRPLARRLGYPDAVVEALPDRAVESFAGVANPFSLRTLRPGERVVDIGSGAGFDAVIAAAQVGPTGRVVGVDMTPQMLTKARQTAGELGLDQLEFREGLAEKLPVSDGWADVVISNGVINLCADKPAVFREMFRVLKPGGRVAVSDIALRRDLPPELAADVSAYVGCVAGAIRIEAYVEGLRAAGFSSVHVVDANADLNAYAAVEGQTGCCSPPMQEKKTALPLATASVSCCGATSVPAVSCCGAPAEATVHGGLATLAERYNINDYAASVKVYAVKPG